MIRFLCLYKFGCIYKRFNAFHIVPRSQGPTPGTRGMFSCAPRRQAFLCHEKTPPLHHTKACRLVQSENMPSFTTRGHVLLYRNTSGVARSGFLGHGGKCLLAASEDMSTCLFRRPCVSDCQLLMRPGSWVLDPGACRVQAAGCKLQPGPIPHSTAARAPQSSECFGHYTHTHTLNHYFRPRCGGQPQAGV